MLNPVQGSISTEVLQNVSYIQKYNEMEKRSYQTGRKDWIEESTDENVY